MKKKNVLTRVQLRQVEDWILGNWDHILEKRLTKNKVATILTNKLNFLVTGHNVANAATAVEKVWPKFVTPGLRRKAPKNTRVSGVLVPLCKTVAKLCSDLGIDCPEEVLAYAERRVPIQMPMAESDHHTAMGMQPLNDHRDIYKNNQESPRLLPGSKTL